MVDLSLGQWLVMGLCQDPSVLGKLAASIPVSLLDTENVRLAVAETCIDTYRRDPALSADGSVDVYPLSIGSDGGATNLGGDPLLEACFECLSSIPFGGAPWQGAWRANALEAVQQGLKAGGLIFVLAARSLEEQRAWARALLQSGCAFVQVHKGCERLPAI